MRSTSLVPVPARLVATCMLVLCTACPGDDASGDTSPADTGAGTEGPHTSGGTPGTSGNDDSGGVTSTPTGSGGTATETGDDDATAGSDSTGGGGFELGCPGGPTVLALLRDGGTYGPGEGGSTVNETGLLPGEVTFSEWQHGDEAWTNLTVCVADLLAPYGIGITTTDPGEVPHLEIAIVGDDSMEAFGNPNVQAVGPGSCDPTQDAIGFVFGGWYGAVNDVAARQLCKNTATLVGQMAGLERVFAPCDVMSTEMCPRGQDYAFGDTDAQCGVTKPAACQCNDGTTQNSHAQMLAVYGACE